MIFDMFKKKSPQSQPHQADADLFDKSRDLVKEATRLKDIDIEQAITTIRQAIAICPEKVFYDYFKLANYIQLAGRPDESFGVLRKLVSELNPSDYHFFNMNMSTISERMSLHLFREKRYRECIWYGTYSDWHQAIALACQGRFVEIPGRIKFVHSRNAQKAFKELKISDRYEYFVNTFITIIDAYDEKLKRLSALSSFISGQDPSQEYIALYRKLNGDIFQVNYDKQLQPLLNIES